MRKECTDNCQFKWKDNSCLHSLCNECGECNVCFFSAEARNRLCKWIECPDCDRFGDINAKCNECGQSIERECPSCNGTHAILRGLTKSVGNINCQRKGIQKGNISAHHCIQQRDINSALSRNVKLFAAALMAGLVSFFLARRGRRVNDEVNDDSWLNM